MIGYRPRTHFPAFLAGIARSTSNEVWTVVAGHDAPAREPQRSTRLSPASGAASVSYHIRKKSRATRCAHVSVTNGRSLGISRQSTSIPAVTLDVAISPSGGPACSTQAVPPLGDFRLRSAASRRCTGKVGHATRASPHHLSARIGDLVQAQIVAQGRTFSSDLYGDF